MKSRIAGWPILLVVSCVCVTSAGITNTTVSTSNKWAWSASAGWLNCRTDITNGVAVGEYVLSGYMYSPSAGWIHLGNGSPTNGVRYCNVSAVDYGVNHDGAGNLSGYAWCASAEWINFSWTNSSSPLAPKINLENGIFRGYAWGGSLGWISLSNLSARLQTVRVSTGKDDDSDGIPDAWEREQTGATNVLAAGHDSDGDSYTDYEEYVLNSCPTNPADCLDFAGLSMDPDNNFSISWFGSPTRLYRVEKKNDLMESEWTDAGTGWFIGDSTSIVSRVLSVGSATQCFFRIRAAHPLP